MADVSFSLVGRRALVTGANSGIGRALALGLAEAGAEVILHHHADPEGAAAVARTVGRSGRPAPVIEANFELPGSATALAEAALSLGAVDILIANAAIERRTPWEDLTDAEINAHVAANFTSTLALVRALAPPMAVRGWGRVVALGSVLAARPRAETVIYAALKSAQMTAVRAIAREVAAQGVTMNIVSPGAIETERTAGRYADAAFRSAVVARIPAGRPGRPEDCVAPVLMLCTEGGGYVTGAEIPVDGGWRIGDAPSVLPEARE